MSNHDQINAGPISAYEKGINLSPTQPTTHSRASSSRPLRNISLLNTANCFTSSLSYTMVGAIRTPTSDKFLARPPRPPNAWILYRSDKVRELSQRPGEPRRVQADVSKEISMMWGNETPEVRAYYDRLADERKAEHQVKFPGYRFQPMKREVKERIKEEKRQEKERERAIKQGRGRHVSNPATPVVRPDGQHPITFPHEYSSLGQTLPMTDSASPGMPGSSSGQQQADNDAILQSLVASFLPPSVPFIQTDPTQPSTLASSSFMQPLQMDCTPQQQPVLQLPSPAPSPWDVPYQWQNLPIADPNTPIWPNLTQNLTGRIASGSAIQDSVSFDLPQSVQQNISDWAQVSDGSWDEAIQALLSTPRDSSIFHLPDLTSEDVVASPGREIEISMGQMPRPATVPDLCNFSPDLEYPSPMLNAQVEESFRENLTVQSLNTPTDDPPRDFSASESFFREFLNFDPLPPQDDTTTFAYPTPSSQVDQGASGPTSVLYIPPSGAAFSSTRRVAASWKPPFTDQQDSPIERSPPRPWSVQAS